MARLQGISDVASLMALYLEGSALVLYLKIDDEDQLGMVNIKQHLWEFYMEGTYTCAELRMVKWTGEQVDEYAAEVQKVAMLSCFTREDLEKAAHLAFPMTYWCNCQAERKWQ